MQTFACQNCGNALFFESTSCVSCGLETGVLDGTLVVALEESGNAKRPMLPNGPNPVSYCANHAHGACNWLVEQGEGDFCLACQHNLTIPDISDPKRLADWRKIEDAKHRLVYMLVRLGLPLFTRQDDPEEGLGFDFLSGEPDGAQVMTGHANGLITIDLAEADDGERERRRTQMGEPYRTLIGHFRHEVGHWYWDRLARDGGRLDEVRAVFGDDTEDYGEALNRHYESGPPPAWQERFVSSYATAHAWEDFAETWAHYLHIVDTLDTASAYRIGATTTDGEWGAHGIDPYTEPDLQRILLAWTPLTVALNAVNRSMGLPDLYPFVLTPAINEKLGLIHRLVRDASNA